MRLIGITLFVYFLHTTGVAQENRFNFNYGIPMGKSVDWNSNNYNFDILFGRFINDQSLLSIGFSHLVADVSPSDIFLTYDKNVSSFFCSYLYEMNLYNYVNLMPEFRLGYAFAKGDLNEFVDAIQKAQGPCLEGLVFFSFNIGSNIDLLIGAGYYVLFSKFSASEDLIITSNFLGVKGKSIDQYIFKLGLGYRFKSKF